MSNKLKNNPRRSISFEKKKKMKVEKNTVLPCFRDNDPPFQAKIKKINSIISFSNRISFIFYPGPRSTTPTSSGCCWRPTALQASASLSSETGWYEMSNKLKNNPRRFISFEKKKMKVEKNTVLPCFRDNDTPFQAKIKK